MKKSYYFDTSIWLDFLEDRNEPNLPKSDWVMKLIQKTIKENDTILFSNLNMLELVNLDYTRYEITEILRSLKPIIKMVFTTPKEVKRAKDLSSKRSVPKADALHSLIARNYKSILVTLDHDFNQLQDISKPYRTNELI